MNINSMKVAIRPMSTTQALDLGMAMARHWFVPLWKIWLGMALPIYVLVYIIGVIIGLLFDMSFEESIGTFGTYLVFLFWWLKPFYEKPMIAWLGEALFSEPPAVKDTVKNGWRNGKLYAFTLLIKKRLSLKRQLILPILMLEKPDKAQFKARLQVLSRGQGGGLGWHTALMVNIEFILSLAAVLLIWQLVPTGLVKAQTLFTILESAPFWTEMISGALYFLVVSIVAPFFVAGGFAVYLTKRCLLEGWDVELIFKDLGQRYIAAQSNSLAGLASPIAVSVSTAVNNTSVNSNAANNSTVNNADSSFAATANRHFNNVTFQPQATRNDFSPDNNKRSPL